MEAAGKIPKRASPSRLNDRNWPLPDCPVLEVAGEIAAIERERISMIAFDPISTI